MPLGLIDGGAHAVRSGPKQTMYEVGGGRLMGRDDKVELFTQASTQWDGLTHVGDRHHDFYNGVQPSDVKHEEGSHNGIENVAEFGVATRAVLIDMVEHNAATEREWRPMCSQIASVEDVAACLRRTKTELGQGDVLLVRTGWLELFRNAAPADRYAIFHDRTYSGLG